MRALSKRVIKWFFRAPGNLFVGSSDQFLERVQRAIRRDVAIASRFVPYRRGERAWAVALDGTAPSAAPLPVPPTDLWLDYGRTAEVYLESGDTRLPMPLLGWQPTAAFFTPPDSDASCPHTYRLYVVRADGRVTDPLAVQF